MKKVIIIEGMANMPMGRAVSHILEGIGGVDNVNLMWTNNRLRWSLAEEY